VLWLIPFLPFLGFVINASLGRRLPKSVSGFVACAAIAGSFGLSGAAIYTMVMDAPSAGGVRALEEVLYTWLPSGALQVPLAFRLDPLSALMILVITGIGSLIHLYSTAYMQDESPSEYARYFSYLNLFASFMLVLVLGANFPVMFIGWEGVGLCSYLLIGFWFTKQSAADAGKKAFVVNRIGDFGFILGMLWLFASFGTLDFQGIAARIAMLPPGVTEATLTGITLLLFLGATGKSAQIPLYIWLPDAMEGPTPVSALIHAATMVTAGVYMIGRNAALFSAAPFTMDVIAVIGVTTALVAGTIGLVQTDIKRVLAYSTVSQLGYMFLAMGVGAFAGGIFHLYTHAFFKALLFLGAGAVIHALHGEQDLRNMGGLRKALPITYFTFLVGTVAIAGIPPLAGFFSKDEILWKTFSHGHTALWAVGMLTAFLTALYMFRLLYLAFFGERRVPVVAVTAHGHGAHAIHAPDDVQGAHSAHAHAPHGHGHGTHLHDAPPAMAIALVVLAIGSIVAGFVGIPHALGGHNQIEAFLDPSFRAPGTLAAEPAHADISMERALMGLSVVVAFAGIGIATLLYLRRTGGAAAIARRFRGAHRLLLNKYYVDEIYDGVIVQPIKRLSGALWRGFDATIIDGTVNGVGLTVRAWSAVLRRVQTGSVRAYAMSLFLGVVTIVGYYLWR
jgi:NADH-quinone oxidoreductase subunit L